MVSEEVGRNLHDGSQVRPRRESGSHLQLSTRALAHVVALRRGAQWPRDEFLIVSPHGVEDPRQATG